MKKPTIFKVFITAVFILLSISSFAQLRKEFATQYRGNLNGDILVIGNNMLNRDENRDGSRANDAFDDKSKVNDNFDMKYINIDNQSTFNSSSATLTIPQTSKTCYEIVYAALYWSGTYQGDDRSKINQIKLKVPNGAYLPITGSVIYDEGGPGVVNVYASKPYACFKEITTEVKAAKEGIYTIGDLVCSQGKITPGGNSAGWSIFVVYKDPLLPSKLITSFDGFSIIRSSDPPLDIPISGFTTNTFGDVNVKLAFAALEGDASLVGDGLQIKGATSSTFGNISSLVRPIAPGTPAIPAVPPKWPRPGRPEVPATDPVPNFFNSTITDGDVILSGRKPSSINTLGYDTGVVKVDNPGNTVIKQGETAATLRISTSSDSYYMFFNALAIEVIAPKIVLRKNVLDKDNKNINGQPVTLNQDLQYEINFRNEGNDNAKNFTITDELPKNVIFGGLSAITMDSRITASYDPITRKIVFTIPDAMVVANGTLTPYSIKFKVKVVDDCNELIDACSNKIENTAYSKYFGEKNTSSTGFGEGSYSTVSACNVGEPTSTNFLVGIKECQFSRDVSLCGSTTLTAALGYKTYVWKDPNGVIFGGNNRVVTITKPGTYTVSNSGAANCEDIQQQFVVKDYLAGTVKNPIKGDNIDPATGEAYTCVRDKKPFPKIFLCGLNDKREIDTGITGATKVTWQETKDVPPVGSPNPDSCPYEGATNWTTIVDNNTKFTADRPGVFRVVVNYGNTCVVTHYFNVYQNKLDSKAEKQDIICNTKGRITVTNPPENTGYSYSLDGIKYQSESTFNDVPKGSYKVQIRQTVLIDGQISACPFFVDVNVEELKFETQLKATHPICTGDLGTITASIANVPGNYKFILRKKNTSVEIQNSGLITDNFYIFKGVEPGFMYEVIMSTANNGCSAINEVEVFDYRLTAEAKVTKTLSECGPGEIQVTVKGGTPRPGPPPYYMYYINGNADYVTDPKIQVTLATLPADGMYNIVVVDDKGCKVTIPPVKVGYVTKPTITVTPTNVDCYGTNAGQIKIDVSPADSGYTVSYSLNNGAFNSISPITNLNPGSYSLVVKYVYEGVECLDAPRTIQITGPQSALNASAGVSELAGCGPAGFEYQGKIRITNVQGGTPLYTYSFDSQKTWINSNEAYVDPGKYTVYVKDSKGCVYAMSDIVLDPKPADPSIEPNPEVVYNCNGTGKATIVVNNTGGANYTYEYYIDTKPNTPLTSNVFNNVPVGKHEISVKYKVVAAATYSNLLQEDFGKGGYTTTPGISPKYCFEDETTPHPATFPSICGDINDYQINDGKYAVASSIKTTFGGTWVVAKDHTLPADKLGRFLCVNIGSSAGVGGIIYSKPIKDVIVNQPVIISLWAENLMKSTTGSGYFDPELTIQLVNDLGGPGETIVATTDTSNPWKVPRNEIWNYKELSLNPGANNNLSFVIRSYNNKFSGNDLLVDDIWVRQLPKSCITEKKFDVIIETNKAFKVTEPVIDDATCNDKNDGKITLAVENFDATNGFKYSINNGVTWLTATTSPFIISGLSKGNYKIIVKNDDAGLCTSYFEKEIKAPLALTTTASITKPSTCLVGASITAVPKGGSPNYKYELYYANGTLYEASTTPTFIKVPAGSYYVVVTDQSSCASPASDPVVVVDPVAPKISIDPSTDLCYDATDKATIIVKVVGGLSPLTYVLNGTQSQKDNNKFVVGPGTYSIVVTDANGCIADAITGIQIGKQIIAAPRVTKLIDCTSSPDAEITIDASEGIGPYKYQVSTDGGTSFADMASNVYKTSIVGSYVFKVTDSKGCSVVTTAAKVDQKLIPTASIASQSDPKCNNDANGSFTVLPAGGSGPVYEFKFNGGTYGTSATYSNLNAFVGAVNTRTYTYQVKDSKGCESIIYEVILKNPTKVVVKGSLPVNTTCSTTTVITINGEGGAGDYKYNFDGGTTYNDVNTKTVTNTTSAQTIKFYVKDGNGCTAQDEIIVPAFNPPTLINFSTPGAITCNTTATSLTLTTVGGIAPITYEITAGPTSAPSNTTGTFTGLIAGDYSFKATDSRGCTVNGKKTIDEAVKIKAEGGKVDEVCFDAKNGKASFTVSDVSSVGNFTYTFSPNTGTPNINGNVVTYTNLAPGTYTFVATDRTTGCSSDSKQVIVGAATAINFTVNGSKINCSTTISKLTITGVSGGSGSYSYAYAISPSTVPTTAYGSILDVDTALLTKSIDVYVKDINDCAVKKTVTIVEEDKPKIDPIPTQCYTGTPISVTITGTYVGTPTYSKDGNSYGPSPIFKLDPGTYKLYLKDGFGCPVSIDYVVADKLTITPTVVPDVTCTTETTISLSSAGGTGTRSYALSYNGGGYATVTSPYTATATGTYKFRVTDSANPTCEAFTEDIPVTLKATVLTITKSAVDVKCNGDKTGSILVTATSGKAPFTYIITKRGGTAADVYTVNNPSGLGAGTYDIEVKDALGCTSAADFVVIDQPTKLVATAHADPFTCNTTNGKVPTDVVIELPTTGKAPYTYSFNGGSYGPSNTLSVSDNGKDQSITYSVKDDNGCTTLVQTITILRLDPPKIDDVSVTPIYCDPVPKRKSTATITLASGTANSYTIVSGQTNITGATTGIFTDLDSGNYTFRATASNGCYDEFFVNIPAVVSMTAIATKLNDVYCFAIPKEATGNIRYNVAKFKTSYSYTINSGTPVTNQTATTFLLSNLGEGIYVVEFTDETTNCKVSTSITITQPAAALILNLDSNVNANCGKATSKVTVHATGGTPDYKYAFKENNIDPIDSDYKDAASADLNPSTNANWDVWVKDSKNCTYKLDVAIKKDLSPTVTAKVDNQCVASGNTFTIIAEGNGGVAPYTYTINTAVAPNPADTFTVGAGTYTITVKDANGCTGTTIVTVYDAMIVKAELTKDLTCAAVTPTDANIKVTVETGGKLDFTYKVSVDGSPYGATGTTFSGTFFNYPVATAGIYKFEITDANNCLKETATVVVKTPAVVTAKDTPRSPTCNGDKDGSVKLEGLTGEGPFKFSFNGGSFIDQSIYGGLIAGSYPYIVRDNKGCEASGTAIVSAPAAIIPVIKENGITCNSTLPGSIDIKLGASSGGTAPFIYHLYDNTMKEIGTYTALTAADASTIHNFPNLGFGDYFINIVDKNGCKFESTALRIAPPPYLIFGAETVGATCDDGISVKLSVNDGTPNFTYSIYGIGTSSGPIPDTNYTFDHLEQNTNYTFVVVDANGCPSYLDYRTPKISNITVTATPKNVTCFNSANGEVTFEVTTLGAGVTELYYELRDNLTNLPIANPKFGSITAAPYGATITDLLPGNYTLYVKEVDGSKCSSTAIFQIRQPASALKATISDVVNANCDKNAFVTVSASGGTGPYTYGSYTAPATAPTSFGDNNVLELPYSPTTTNYNIVVKDSQGCPVTIGQIISKDPSPEISLAVDNKCVAEDNYGIVVTLSKAGIKPYSIKVDNGVFVDYPATFTFPYTITGLHSGSHKITIKDKNGCEDVKTIVIDAPLKVEPFMVTPPDCGVSNGEVSLVPSGGSGAYSYSIAPSDPSIVIDAVNNKITGLKDGKYTVTMTDNTNIGCDTTAEFTLVKGTDVTFDAEVTNALCKDDANGTITVNLLPGNDDPAYTYVISSATATPLPIGIVQIDNVFKNLPKGSYRITVTSKRKCSLFKDYSVGEPVVALGANVIVKDFGCLTGDTPEQAGVTITGTGGTSPYKYNFDGGSDYTDVNKVLIDNDGNPHTVNYYVIDFNGCKTNGSTTINPFKKLTDIKFVASVLPTCPLNETEVTLTAVGGYAIDKYELVSPVYRDNGTSAVFGNLVPDIYLFRVTDVNGCSIERSYKVESVSKIDIVKTSSINVSCNTANGTDNNGQATFTVSDFSTTGNYTIAVASVPALLPFNAPTVANDVITITGLVKGTYTITVTDKTTNCSKSADVEIVMPAPIDFTPKATKVFCSEQDSQITITGITGGTANYKYAVVKTGDPAPTTFVDISIPFTAHTGLTDLSWDVYVQDSNLCVSAPKTVPVTFDIKPVLNQPAQQCYVDADITIDFGVAALSTTYNGNKTFTIDGLPVGRNITFKKDGTYRIVLKDDNGCEAFIDYVIEKRLTASISVDKDLFCTGDINAKISVKVTGGKADYSYQMFLNGAAVGGLKTTTGSFTESVSAFGDYYFEITDSNVPCPFKTETVTVNEPKIPTLANSQTNVRCFSESNGTLTVVPSGGALPYTFVLTGAVNTTGDASGVYTGLPKGNYTVVATDAKGCLSIASTFSITEPVKLTASHDIPANTTCSTSTIITVEGHDGTPTGIGSGYYYNFNNLGYGTENTFSVNIDSKVTQTVTYQVKDANGCETAPVTITIDPLNKPTALTFSATAVTCAATSSNVTVKATNGVGTLTFEITAFNGLPIVYPVVSTPGNAVAAVFNGLLPGVYTFNVKDSNGCSYSDSFTVKDVIKITVEGESFDKTCISNDDGKAIFTVANFTGTYTYTITKDANPPSAAVTTSDAVVALSNLAIGSYKIDIVDDITSCPVNATVTVKDPLAVTVTEESNVNANCKTGAVVTVLGHGGTPGYTYSFVPASPTATPGTFLPEATRELDPATPSWYVYAKDQNGCISVPRTVNIILDPLPAGFTATATSQCADGLGNYEIVITPGTGMGPFTYSIGSGFQSETNFIVKVPKVYDLVVRDKFGCEFEFKTAVTILAPVILDVKKDNDTTCADGDGQVTASAVGGSGNFSYTLDGVRTIATTPAVFDKLSNGSHTIIVTDLGTTSNCTDQIKFDLLRATPITGFDAYSTPVSCNTGSDGTITATIAATSPRVNDDPNYKYSLDNGPLQDSPVFKGLKAGTYKVSVISGRDCKDSKLVEVIEPDAIKVPAPALVPYGCVADNISNFATITVNGVTGGSGKYIYEFINGTDVKYKGPRNVFTEMDYKGGTYSVNVYDDNDCMGSALGTFTIQPFVAMDKVVVTVNNAITCVKNEDITVTVNSIAGAPIAGTLNYSLSGTNGTVYGPIVTTDGIFTDLGIGNYIVTVTNGATGCTIQAVHFINNSNTFDIIATPENDKVCFGATDARVQLTFVDNQPNPNNEAGAFEYTITGGALPISGTTTGAGPIWVSNLTAGQYKVVAKLVNRPECTVQTTFTIEQPNMAFTVSKTQSEITCVSGNKDGIIVASASGGWPGEYLYELRSGTTVIKSYNESAIFDNLPAGDYRVYAKDSFGCESFVDAKLVNPTPISIAIGATPMLTCFDNEDGIVTINTISGGSGNYTYTLHGVLTDGSITLEQSQGSNQFTGLKAGTYYITVNDTWTCTSDSNKVIIDQPTIVKANLTIEKTETCRQVPVVRLTAAGGNAPYYYSTDGISYTGPFNSYVDITLPVTTTKVEYKYFVKDSQNCRSYVSNTSEFLPVPALGFEYSSEIDIKCKGGATGSITVRAKGGLGNYIYILQDTAGVNITPAPTQLIPGTFTNLPIGDYIVKVTSLDCEVSSALFKLTEPNSSLVADAIATPLTCNGYNNGIITVNATGGVGTYKYAIEPEFKQFFDKNVFENLKPGFYDILVQDENECYVFIKDVEVKEPDPIIAIEIPNSMIPEVCFGDKDGQFAIEIKGGNAPYTASLDNDKGPFILVNMNTVDYKGLTGGKHTVYIIDKNGCNTEVEVNMPLPVVLDPTYEINYDCVNNAQTNMVTITVDESNTDLTQVDYALDSEEGPFQASNIFTNVAPGRHFIVARHTNGCKVPTTSFDIKAYEPLTLDLTGGQQEMNVISVIGVGGAPAYEYSFNGEPFTSSNKYKIYKSGDYVVIVRDKNGCTFQITVPAIYIDVCLDNYFTPAGATNTTWGPGCTNIYNNLVFSIFDRYGRVIAKYHYGQKWDGRYNGAELPSGDYWYVLKLNDAKDDREFVGHFTLYR